MFPFCLELNNKEIKLCIYVNNFLKIVLQVSCYNLDYDYNCKIILIKLF